MASSSSSWSSQIRRFHVFTSFHGPDVRRGFLSHLQNHFESKGITMFKDQEIERGHSIGPELVKAIQESRLSLILLSENYASSSWCLDELVEVLKCREATGQQTVMTIFYQVDPSSVRKQKGDFGVAFMRTCQGKSEDVKQKWIKALTDVANIEGEHSLNWPNEAEMIQKIATDVSKKLNVITHSRDFDGMVGLEAHLLELESLLSLECDDVKMVGIWGPAGIGKTTIARALYNKLSSHFEFTCFMGNLKGNYKNTVMGVDDYDSMLWLQNQLLSKILNRKDMKLHHLGAIKEWLHDQSVLIILDDVDDLEKLEVLAKETSWFGPRSRIIVTTEDKRILKAHGINEIYNVNFPSEKEALEILCLSAFQKPSLQDGFKELAIKVAGFCNNLPLGLSVVGSSLRGESKNEWELQLYKIETSLDRKIEDVLKVGYDRLSKKDQALFLHIACFFFFQEDVDYVTNMLAHSNLDVGNGLKNLVDKSMVHISIYREIVMHKLLQKMGKQVVVQQSHEPGKRQFLVEPQEIKDVLENETGTGSLIGINFDMSKMGEVSISKRAFKEMRNLQFLRIYTQVGLENEIDSFLHMQDDLEYLPRLRLLYWHSYPRASLPATFQTDRLVELHMSSSNLEKLWDGIQPLGNLKIIDLNYSYLLKEIPNLSNATSLEKLTLVSCSRLVELPTSIRNLHKLKKLIMSSCENLRVIPTNINLASLEEIDMSYCSQLRIFPDISRNIKTFSARYTKIKDVPASVVARWSRCEKLEIGNKRLERLSAPRSVTSLNLINSDIKRIPDCIIGLAHLVDLIVENCTKLVSIPTLPPSLESLNANNCVSLKRVCCSFQKPITILTFYNCMSLDEESRRGIIQQLVTDYKCLPGKQVPVNFTRKAKGKSITIPLASVGEETFNAYSKFRACFLVSPIERCRYLTVSCSLTSKGGDSMNNFCRSARLCEEPPRSEHLFLFSGDLFGQRNRSRQVDVATSEVLFDFSCWYNDEMIIECGVQLLAEEDESSSEVDNSGTEISHSELDDFETESSSSEAEFYETGGSNTDEDVDYEEVEAYMVSQGENNTTNKHTRFQSWLEKLRRKKSKIRAKLSDGKK